MAAPRIPTRGTQFINPEAERMRGMSALEALRGYAGVPSQASVMHPGSAAGYESGELAGMAEMLVPGAAMAKGALGAALAGVIKPRGGNWLTGSVENALAGLVTPVRGVGQPGTQALNRWVEGPLTRYVKTEMATPEDPLRLQAESWPAQQRDLLAAKDAQIAKATADMERARAERGFTLDMMTSSMAHIRGLMKQRDYIAEQTGLHFNPLGIRDVSPAMDLVLMRRGTARQPLLGEATEPVAEQWERYADLAIEPRTAGEQARHAGTLGKNPWLSRLSPEEVVYGVDYRNFGGPMAGENLGFTHLVDELNNALNPESGLPADLLIDPAKLSKMTVPQVAKRVDEINAWRATQVAEADKARAANAATVEVRPYDTIPGTDQLNVKGLRWVELRQPEPKMGEGWQIKEFPAIDGFEVVDELGRQRSIGSTKEEALGLLNREDRLRAIKDALKYEGEMLQHCVGGYCSDVLEGKSRIFSLRDAEGRPHATIEVQPEDWLKRPGAVKENPLIEKEWSNFYREMVRQVNGNPSTEDLRAFKDYMLTRYPDDESVAAFFNPSFNIQQIKGKKNAAPAEEYLPFVQDFVRNNPLGTRWGKVGDLQNTGLRQAGDRYVTPEELKDVPRTPDGFPEGYVPFDDRPEWAEGGIVHAPRNWRRMELGGTIGYLMEG